MLVLSVCVGNVRHSQQVFVPSMDIYGEGHYGDSKLPEAIKTLSCCIVKS